MFQGISYRMKLISSVFKIVQPKKRKTILQTDVGFY